MPPAVPQSANSKSQPGAKPESDVIGTLMSLTVAFTLAMAFRGFILEGFVIPTGSMGPTLMGAHVRIDSPITGYEYPADSTVLGDQRNNLPAWSRVDPMISPHTPVGTMQREWLAANSRAGDRVLVLKPLFLVSEPERWDVVVFKNPTDPIGETQNFIKRLVGLPNETLLLIDGDVFTGPAGAESDTLRIQRKPEYVQRAVWQPVYDSDFEPMVSASILSTALRSQWVGPPWRAVGTTAAQWTLAPKRAWEFAGTGRSALEWNTLDWPVDDWDSYNALRETELILFTANRDNKETRQARAEQHFAVKDLRVTAVVECTDLAQFSTELTLVSGREQIKFTLSGRGTATVSRAEVEDPTHVLGTDSYTFTPDGDNLLKLEFWHVDQQLWVFAEGELVGQMPYEYEKLQQRIAATSGYGRTVENQRQNHVTTMSAAPVRLTWTFDSAAPFALHRVRLDRDLYYRPVNHSDSNQYRINGPLLEKAGFATDWDAPARLGPDDFLMLGDNSGYSRDGRVWGRAHEIVLRTFGDSQPGVVPREMIVGKAWAVYFPAPLPLSPGGATFIPDFGRLRFIR